MIGVDYEFPPCVSRANHHEINVSAPPDPGPSQKKAGPAENLDSPSVKSNGGLYLNFLGWLQIGIGSLHLVFSLVGMGALLPEQSLSPGAPFESSFSSFWLELGYTYFALQIYSGWLLGLLSIFAGWCTLRRRGLGFIAAANLLNLLFFPGGTVVAAAVYHALSSKTRRSRFR